MDKKNLLPLMEKWKLPLLILFVGLALMFLPTESKREKEIFEPQEALSQLLSETQGVGKAQVLISENGVVIACQGAKNASVRLDIIRAVSSYTGFGSDKITILKLRN